MSPAILPPPKSGQFPTRKWTVAEFENLVDVGVLREGGPEFLWDGEIIVPPVEEEPHVNACGNLLRTLYDRLIRDHWIIRAKNPLGMREGFLPNPDTVVLPGLRSDYRGRRPTTSDASLVVEIADASDPIESKIMLPEYARAGVVHLWIIHIPAKRVEVYRNPRVVEGVGVYDPPTLYELDAAVPLSLRPGPGQAEILFDPIPVRDILCDSMETNP